MNWKRRLEHAFGSNTPDDEILEELAQHAAAIYASARAEGGDPPEANRRVEQQIRAWAANPALLRRRPKRDPAVAPPPGTAPPLASVMQDARYAWRLLRRQP